MSRIGVMHITDTLAAAGAERVAVNLVNSLPRERFEPYLCTTREEGPLSSLIKPDVGRLSLARTWRFDVKAVRRLAAFIEANQIRILHAHCTALFVAKWAAMYAPRTAVVWHDHFGLCMVRERPRWIYRFLTRDVGGVVAVNQRLADWSRERLQIPADRVWYVPNFVCEPQHDGAPPNLPGQTGKRLVCVAKFRPQKDHLTLLRAMALVKREEPAAHLLLVGGADDSNYLARIHAEIDKLGLGQHVTCLGERHDVSSILQTSDIGVLSSESEGMPLALLEYGTAGLATVATDVGQCSEVLANGEAGLLVPPGAPAELARAMTALVRSPEGRKNLGQRLKQRVTDTYGAEAVMRQICQIYERLIIETTASRSVAC